MLGHKFNSGAICVALAPSTSRDEYIILCVRTDGSIYDLYDRFVVSRIAAQDVITHSRFPEGGSWYSGHYHVHLKDAVDTFTDMTGGGNRRVLVKSIEQVMRELGLPKEAASV